jgi:DNA gyrase subunit A
MTDPLLSRTERVQPVNVADEIKNSFLDYSMSVIISRALPDVRDGLKPSQRRILYAMYELSLFPGRKHMKCAKICGDTSGNYHPHGEAVIYPTLVHMAQPWSMRDPLIDPQGNFGSVEGDPPAAMRYTEARLTALGTSLMQDMDQDTVDFVPNYDERLTEPVVFPAAFPNLLVNGGTGIAVGMATNLAPHNLSEIIEAICAQIDDSEISWAKLLKIVKGPDFPTGCTIVGTEGIRNYLMTGRGSIRVRGRIHTEELKGGREQLVITEIPYAVNREELEKKIADLANTKVIADISGTRNESDENTRLVIELKRDANPKVVINNLYKHTLLATTFSVNMLVIDRGKPKTLNLKELINCYIDHRREVILRRTRYLLRKAEERAETLEGYLVALSNLDDFIRIIRESANRDEARIKLGGYEFPRKVVEGWGIQIRNEQRLVSGRYALSASQIDNILDLRLYQLTGMEQAKIQGEYAELLRTIADLLDILEKESRVMAIIKAELKVINDKHGSKRRTEIVPDEGEMAIEDLIANEQVVVTITHNGLIKRTNADNYRAQRRGGKGVTGMALRETERPEDSDFIEHLFIAYTHDYLMFFTSLGRVYVQRMHEIPDMGRAAKGRSIANLLELRPGETVATTIPITARKNAQGEDTTWDSGGNIFFATQNGTIKKTSLKEFANVRKGGIIAIGIEPGNLLIDVLLTSGQDEVVLITKEGMSIRFAEGDVRTMGRPAVGVKGITLAKTDEVVASAVVNPSATLLVAGENGVGKRTSFEEYRLQSRGGKGIITQKVNDKTGYVIGALTVTDRDEFMLITSGGQMVRTKVAGVRECGRNSQGVKLVNLDPQDKLTAIAPVVIEEESKAEETLPGV